MAYIGRGESPSIETNNDQISDNHNYFEGGHYHYYIKYDSTYIFMELISIVIVILIAFGSYVFGYRSSIIDPIENIKNTYMTSYLSIISIICISGVLINFLLNKSQNLKKILSIIFILSIITFFSFFVIKLNLDNTYTKDKFENLYTNSDVVNENSKSIKIDMNFKSIIQKSDKDIYINECMKLYNIFSIKTYLTIGLNLFVSFIFIMQIVRISKIEHRKEKSNKDDLVLFDEEENIKF